MKPDTPEYREEIRRAIRRQRDALSALTTMLETVDHEAARDVETARSALFAAWSKIRRAPPMEPVCPLIRQALRGHDDPAAYDQGEAHRREFPTTE